jgi:predicted RNase H-like nuclease (RuvC/YqgF family)
MAQNLQKIFPNAVTKGDDGFLRIRMEDMFYAVVNAIKELDAKIEKLRQEEILTLRNDIEKLKKENVELKKQNESFEKRLEKLEKKTK